MKKTWKRFKDGNQERGRVYALFSRIVARFEAEERGGTQLQGGKDKRARFSNPGRFSAEKKGRRIGLRCQLYPNLANHHSVKLKIRRGINA